MGQTVGTLIKEARTGAKLTQTQLAELIDGVSANDISKAERGDKDLSQAVLKQIAKITGVTQSSLINAAKAEAADEKPAASAKTASAKKESSAKKETSAKAASKNTFELTAAEKKLVELYRAADSDTKKAAVALLKGENTTTDDLIGTLLGGAMEMLTNMKK